MYSTSNAFHNYDDLSTSSPNSSIPLLPSANTHRSELSTAATAGHGATPPSYGHQSFDFHDHELYHGLVDAFPLSNSITTTTDVNASRFASSSSAVTSTQEMGHPSMLVTATASDDLESRCLELQNRVRLLEAERTSLEQRLALYKDVIKNNVREDLAARVMNPYEDLASQLCNERMDVVEAFVAALQRPNWVQLVPSLLRTHCEETMRMYSSDLIGGDIDRRGFWVWLEHWRRRHRECRITITAVDPDDCSGQHMKVSFEFQGDNSCWRAPTDHVPGPETTEARPYPQPLRGQGHVFLVFRSTSLQIMRQVWVWKPFQQLTP